MMYAVVFQESGTTQGLVSAKARLAKKDLTIPCLELVSAHMAVISSKSPRCSSKNACETRLWLDRQHSDTLLDKGCRELQAICHKLSEEDK